jgi:hypothetical protein
VRVCVTPYAPFIMPVIYATGNATLAGPIPIDMLNDAGLVPDGEYDPSSASFPLTGYDVGIVDLVLTQMLNLNVSYVIRQTYLELYLALRSGRCDIGVSAAELCAPRVCGAHGTRVQA